MAVKGRFQFVEAKSQSSGDDAQTRRLVRSNATKFRWQQSRNEKLKQSRIAVRPHVMKMAFEVGAGTFDPFETMPTNLPPDTVTRGLNYNKEVILPKLMPLAGSANEKLHKVLPVAVTNRALFNCLMIGAMSYQQAARKFLGPKETRSLVQCRNEAVSALRSTLTDPANATSDVTILSVLVLVYSGPMVSYSPPRRFPSQGPLQHLQSLYVYTATEVVETHLRGLRTLIDLRGGLSKLTLPGLSAIISSGDIMRATRWLDKPFYEPFSLVKGPQPQLSVSAIVNIRLEASTLVNLSTGFQVLGQSAPGVLLRDVTGMIADYVVFIGDLAQEQRPHEKVILIDQRNLAQHRLMSLPSCDELSDDADPAHLALYESFRISSIIFGILVVMPMNYATAPFENLARMLRSICARTDLRQYMEAFLWISTMGAISSFSLQDDDYFIAELAHAAASLELKHWEDYKAILEKFLWLPATNDVDAKYLWSTISSLDI